MLGTEGMLTEGQPALKGKLQLDEVEDEADVAPAPDVESGDAGDDPCDPNGPPPLNGGLAAHLGMNCCNCIQIKTSQTSQLIGGIEKQSLK